MLEVMQTVKPDSVDTSAEMMPQPYMTAKPLSGVKWGLIISVTMYLLVVYNWFFCRHRPSSCDFPI